MVKILCAMVIRMRRFAREMAVGVSAAATSAVVSTGATVESADEGAHDDGGSEKQKLETVRGDCRSAGRISGARGRIVRSNTRGAPLSAMAVVEQQKCTIATLVSEYAALCLSQRVKPLTQMEVCELAPVSWALCRRLTRSYLGPQVLPLVESLVACGLLAIGSASASTKASAVATCKYVWLCISEGDLQVAIEQVRFFRNILADERG